MKSPKSKARLEAIEYINTMKPIFRMTLRWGVMWSFGGFSVTHLALLFRTSNMGSYFGIVAGMGGLALIFGLVALTVSSILALPILAKSFSVFFQFSLRQLVMAVLYGGFCGSLLISGKHQVFLSGLCLSILGFLFFLIFVYKSAPRPHEDQDPASRALPESPQSTPLIRPEAKSRIT